MQSRSSDFHGVQSPKPVMVICVSGSPDFVSCFFQWLCYVGCRAQIAQEVEEAVHTRTRGSAVLALSHDTNVGSSGLGCHKPLLLSILAAAFSIVSWNFGFGAFMHVELGWCCATGIISCPVPQSLWRTKQREDTLLITPSVSQGCS